jgi:hypothetical protein
MLSYHASSRPQLMHAERGETTERRSGMRAASTFRKLPTASPGASAQAASAAFTPSLSAVGVPELSDQPEKLCGGFGCAYTAGFDGIPDGTVVIVGKLFVVRLLLSKI